MTFETHSAEETFEIGKKLGEEAKPGEVYLLTGDLGAGKTVFAKGFAAGLGITKEVTSPTFTIMHIYDEGRLPLYHFDVYRIDNAEDLMDTGSDEYFYGSGVCLVEWADRIADFLPDNSISVEIKKDYENGDDIRHIEVSRDRFLQGGA